MQNYVRMACFLPCVLHASPSVRLNHLIIQRDCIIMLCIIVSQVFNDVVSIAELIQC
jgi:hypothetical protein